MGKRSDSETSESSSSTPNLYAHHLRNATEETLRALQKAALLKAEMDEIRKAYAVEKAEARVMGFENRSLSLKLQATAKENASLLEEVNALKRDLEKVMDNVRDLKKENNALEDSLKSALEPLQGMQMSIDAFSMRVRRSRNVINGALGANVV